MKGMMLSATRTFSVDIFCFRSCLWRGKRYFLILPIPVLLFVEGGDVNPQLLPDTLVK